MLKKVIFQNKKLQILPILISFLLLGFQNWSYSYNTIEQDTIGYIQFKGKVIDSKSKKPLIFATLTVNETNISTVTNTQGKFLLKVPNRYALNKVTISFLGYTSKVLDLVNFNINDETTIKLETYIEELTEVSIISKDAKSLVEEVLRRTAKNYIEDHIHMTAFYRETIKKRRSYVSLSEAVVEIYKQPYTSNRNDLLKLYKARKNTDYEKLDTVALKLRGGPFSTLHLDIIKNPAMFFTEDMMDSYEFNFNTSTKIDNKPIYVINFKQRPHISEPLFYGKLYIDAQSLALVKAKFDINLENVKEATKIFVLKKPKGAKVEALKASYYVDYRVKNKKWYYGYSRIELGFKINWDKKLFNSIYYSTMEMAITDWEKHDPKTTVKIKDRLKPSVILSDQASGFSDPEFWGAYNVIEPEKPIESAIKKIQKQLKRIKEN